MNLTEKAYKLFKTPLTGKNIIIACSVVISPMIAMLFITIYISEILALYLFAGYMLFTFILLIIIAIVEKQYEKKQ